MIKGFRMAAGIAALAALGLSTAACTTAPAATTKPATEVLVDAAAKGQGQSFTFQQTYGTILTSNGAQDASGENWKSSMTLAQAASGLTIKADVLSIGPEIYMKVDLGPLTASIPGLGDLGQKWLRVDRSKIGTGGLAGSLLSSEGMTAEAYIKGVLSAERASDTEIKGTLDLTASAPSVVAASELAKLGPEAKNVPFTASLDADGRIAKIVISMPAVGNFPASDLTTSYSDYGSEVVIPKPAAAEVVEAPAMIYQFLV